jgi:condensin-2 complex subunit D3
VSGPDISALCRLCNDASVATRKAAGDALTKLVQANNDDEEYSAHASSLEVAWAHTVLPLIADAEATCVTKALEFFSALVIEPIIELDDGAESRVAWRILSKLSGRSNKAGASRNASGSLILALQKLLLNAGKDAKILSKNLLRAVHYAIGISLGLDRPISFDSVMAHENGSKWGLFEVNTTEMRIGAWCLLDALTSCLISIDIGSAKFSSLGNVSLSQAMGASQINSSFLVSSLRNLRGLMNSKSVSSDMKINLIGTSQDCLKVFAKMGDFVPLDDAEACFSELYSDLKSFTIPVDLISVTINALITFTKRMCDDSGKDVFIEVKAWVNSLLNECERAIENQFSAMSQRGMMIHDDEKLLSIILHFVGELSLVGFTSQEDSSLLCTTTRNDITPTDGDPVRGLLIRPSARLAHLIKLMLPNTMPIPSAADHELTQTPVGIRAYSFITLGRLCLRDESLAKESLNILARELHSDSNPVVQSNSLMVLGDLCVRYTNLVDKYLPFMAATLQAGDGKSVEVNTNCSHSLSHSRKCNSYSMVKKNAIMLLSSLLLQDYIKWRGLLIHRFLAAVADEDDEVSQLAQTALRGPLLQKQPNLFANHFVGAVFVLNMCKAHPIYTAELGSGDSGLTVDFQGASFAGSLGYHKRREVYEVMLANMNDEHKLEVTARLVKEVLGGALETSGDLSAVCKFSAGATKNSITLSNGRIEAAKNVLTDTLTILTSPQIRVGRKGAQDAEDDLGGSRPDQRNAHKQRLLTRISRKHLIEIVIPILCNLKSVLESSHSPILKSIMTYLGYIFRNYKSEVQEYLANKPILLQELEYDTRQYEKKHKHGSRVSVLPSDVVIDEPV